MGLPNVKRGDSGLSLVIGIDKPAGMTSHDVVNRARRAFGEKRVGHAGTLDPMAEGVLPILIGPATRLSEFLTGHDKVYVARIRFGSATTTDDREGDILRTAAVPSVASELEFATGILDSFKGPSKQMPPAYSAIKVNGKKAYDEARRGHVVALEPRDIEVYRADLIDIGFEEGVLFWDVVFSVSKGTYIRSLARDIGKAVGTQAHLGALQRIRSGNLTLDECVSLQAMEELRTEAALDPVRLLGYRFLCPQGEEARKIDNGNLLPVDGRTMEIFAFTSVEQRACACTSGVTLSEEPLSDGELISIVADNTLKAIYAFDARQGKFIPKCVFSKGVERG